MTQPIAEHPCWKFVVELYSQPGVSPACLLLQDRLGVDVSFLLTALFHVQRHGVDLSAEAIALLDRSVWSWRNDVIVPLRAVRRRLKESASPASPADDLYRRIKTDELLAEQIEIGMLDAQLARMPGRSPAQPINETVAAVVKHFAAAASQSAHLADADIHDAMTSIANAVMSLGQDGCPDQVRA